MEICLVTQNPGKIKSAAAVFSKFDHTLVPAPRDFFEIQASSSLEIARHTAIETANELKIPAIREDHSLFIGNLGLPGPYTNFWEKQLPADELLDLLHKLHIWHGRFEVATVYADPNGHVIEHTFQVPMTFGTENKEPGSTSWNGLIRLQNETRSITEYPEEERLHIWNQGYEKIAREIATL